MLNITSNSIKDRVEINSYHSFFIVSKKRTGNLFIKICSGLILLGLLILFVPWTQNIQAIGNVTALRPDQRPQTIHSIIPGRIEKWFVKEGDFVKKGDTILFISEIKDEYFDPSLLKNTEQQLKSKELSVRSYMDKIKALDNQVDAMNQTRILKLEQALNKIQQANLKIKSDSMDYQASILNYKIAREQVERMEQLYKDGLKSLTDLEARKLKLQEADAKRISQENKLLTSRNEKINALVELSSIKTEFNDKISKTESEKYSAMSNMYDAEAVVTKLQNQYMNYSVRSGYYYISAPQDGYITKAIKTGLGENIKEGEEIISIMPASYDLAVEMYVMPIDLPLVEKGQAVRIQFDGWPAVVFSGWPNTSYGTYGGKVVAIDNFISDNGKYRLLITADPGDHPWPKALRVGAGARTMALLKDVPIWYELWRKINGFPPDYYKQNEKAENKK
ncbi:MAG: HlyD family secretion protein [Bacteroidia bacterium]